MQFIILTSASEKKSEENMAIHINAKYITDVFELKAVENGLYSQKRVTVVGVLGHNNGGYRVKETAEEIVRILSCL